MMTIGVVQVNGMMVPYLIILPGNLNCPSTIRDKCNFIDINIDFKKY